MTYTPVENTILNLLKKGSYKTSLFDTLVYYNHFSCFPDEVCVL